MTGSRDSQFFDVEIRPSKDLDAFLARLQGGLDFTKRQTNTWSIEDWEAAVDAGNGNDWPASSHRFNALALLKDCSSNEVFSGHGFWILFALAYLRGHAACIACLPRHIRPFRTEQLSDINIPESMSVMVTAQFKLGYDTAWKTSDGRNTVPEWIKRALAAPLSRSRAERSSAVQ